MSKNYWLKRVPFLGFFIDTRREVDMTPIATRQQGRAHIRAMWKVQLHQDYLVRRQNQKIARRERKRAKGLRDVARAGI